MAARLPIVLVSVFLACGPVSPAVTDPASEIETLLQQSARRWNAGDLEGFLITYARDSAITFLTTGGMIRGFDAVRARYAPRFAPDAVRDSLRFTDLEVRALTPDWALVTARYVLERGDSVTATGPFTVVMRRQTEGWRMIHDHTS